MENSDEDELFVFVGEKIELQELKSARFLCKYKILEKICGNYERDTIEFVTYDTLGIPAFEKYNNVLLYLAKSSEGFWHYYNIPYQYNELYLTKDQHWASPYSPRNYESIDANLPKVKPVKLEFTEEVSFDISGKNKEYLMKWFPEPYYRIAGNKAFAEYGNYIPELFQLKKQGVFKKSGLFGKNDEIKISRVEAPELLRISDSSQLIATFHLLLNGIINQDAEKIRSLSFDSVFCSFCGTFPRIRRYNTYLPIDSFISASLQNLPGNEIKKQVADEEFSLFVNKSPVTTRNYIDTEPDGKRMVYSIYIHRVRMFGVDDSYMSHDFEFLKVKGKFLFNGISSMYR